MVRMFFFLTTKKKKVQEGLRIYKFSDGKKVKSLFTLSCVINSSIRALEGVSNKLNTKLL